VALPMQVLNTLQYEKKMMVLMKYLMLSYEFFDAIALEVLDNIAYM
jgi:hypothetical protein